MWCCSFNFHSHSLSEFRVEAKTDASCIPSIVHHRQPTIIGHSFMSSSPSTMIPPVCHNTVVGLLDDADPSLEAMQYHQCESTRSWATGSPCYPSTPVRTTCRLRRRARHTKQATSPWSTSITIHQTMHASTPSRDRPRQLPYFGSR